MDHPRGDRYHDDYANVLCLAAAIASQAEPRKKLFQDYDPDAWQKPPVITGPRLIREEVRREQGVAVVYRVYPDGRAVRDRIGSDPRAPWEE